MSSVPSRVPPTWRRRLARLCVGKCGFLASEAATLGVVSFSADRMWYRTHFPAATWLLVQLVWLVASAGGTVRAAAGRRRGDPTRHTWAVQILAAGLCALAVKACADPFSWKQAGAFAILSIAALSCNRLLLGVILKSREPEAGEGLRFAAAQAVALFAVHPYVRSALLGSGDALSYSQMVADFREQWRSGIFPVLVGQSRFAFNGGFQPIRNAPLFQHLAWGFDVLSLGTLNAFALQNLAVLASILAGVLGCYAALRISLAKAPWLSLGLAALYGLCPGILAPLYGGDMYITFMTVPFIPWLALGIARSSESPDLAWPWVLQGAALAGMWLAHPPVAAWGTFVALVAALWVAISNRRRAVFVGMILGSAGFLALGGYLFVSVGSLGLPVVSRSEAAASIGYKLSTLRDDWAHSFLPVDAHGARLMGDIQLGYGLWICVLLSIVAASRLRSGRSLIGCFALILLFAWPVPVLTEWAWRSLPSDLLVVTNQWPAERFYVLLPAFAVFIAGPALHRYCARGSPQRTVTAALILSACLWSGAESTKFFRRAAEASHTEGESENLHLPENITLSRTHSYEYLGTPEYYSNGHMDPRLETRLIDGSTLRVFADGSTSRPGAPSPVPGTRTFSLHRGASGIFAERLHIGPHESFVLRFDFLGQHPDGEFQIRGRRLYDFYSLPQSGRSGSFGSGPGAGRTLMVENSTGDADELSFAFIGRDDAAASDIFARVSAEPLSEGERTIRLDSLTPFHAFVSADRSCYLETPKLFIPGYGAVVDGSPTGIVRSANGLVAVPLAKGEHDVSLAYFGGPLLRWSYAASASAWLALLALVGAYALRVEGLPVPAAARDFSLKIASVRNRTWGKKCAYAVLGIAAAAAATVAWVASGAFSTAPHGSVHLIIKLPLKAAGQSEPLLTTGRTGAGDFIYVTYVDGGHVVVGHDKWSIGGARSAPIAVDFQEPQKVEISMNSLNLDPHGPGRVFVRWNGVLVFSETADAYPSLPSEVTVGENAIGGSTTLPHFSGEILGVSRGNTAIP
jgi:hypothetical protein